LHPNTKPGKLPETTMTAGELCNRTVYIIRPNESVLEAARLMKKYHVGCLVVVQERGTDRVPIALVTDRDLVVKGIAEARSDLETMSVGEVMSNGLTTARDTEELYDVRKKMRARGVRRIPVVDAEDRLQGIIAFDDMVDWMAQELIDLAQLVSREQQRESES
jgi:CBS domain-containing protein